MVVFALLLVKITATLFLLLSDILVNFSAPSILILFAWVSDAFSATFFAFKSDLLLVLFGLYLLVWLVTPWLSISNRGAVKVVGLSFAIGSNLFDIISCILTTLSVVEKTCNLIFSVFVICLSIWSIRDELRGTRGRFSCLLRNRSNRS